MNTEEPSQEAHLTATSGILKAYYELTKPRLNLMSVLTAVVGYLAATTTIEWTLLLNIIFGTASTAAGAAVLNSWMEREIDACMPRTRGRPLPSGQIGADAALVYGICLGTIGCLFLLLTVNGRAALLALSTLVIYVLIYTPLKSRSPWCTEIGAVAGALPPLIGWAAAEGVIDLRGWVLFGILFAWQMPHFMAIAWRFREDYRQGGLPMLSVIDPSGDKVAGCSLIYTLLLILLSMLWWGLSASTLAYGIIAIALNAYILYKALRFAKETERDVAAVGLFHASIIYLPILMGIMVIDRWFIS